MKSNLPGFRAYTTLAPVTKLNKNHVRINSFTPVLSQTKQKNQEAIIPAYMCSDHSCDTWRNICYGTGWLTLGGSCVPYQQCCQNPTPGFCDLSPCQKGCPPYPGCPDYGGGGHEPGYQGSFLTSDQQSTDLSTQIDGLRKQLRRIEKCACGPMVATYVPNRDFVMEHQFPNMITNPLY